MSLLYISKHMKFTKITFLVLLAVLLFVSEFSKAENNSPSENKKAVYDLIQRVLPDVENKFEIEFISKDVDDKDVFEIESVNGKILLRGNNGISIASALNY